MLSAGVPRDRIRFYAPWATIDPRPVAGVDAAALLTALVSEIAGDGAVVLGADVVYSHQLALAEALDVTTESGEPTPVRVHAISTAEVEERFTQWRERGAVTATELIADVAHLNGLAADFGVGDTRYSRLESLATERELDALVIAAPPNFSEVTGHVPGDGAVAVWVPGTDRILVAASDAADRNHYGTAVGEYASLGEAVTALIPGRRIGVEEEFISVSAAGELAAHGLELVRASTDLAHWRDIRDNEDLPFQVLAARTSVYAIVEALRGPSTKSTPGSNSPRSTSTTDTSATSKTSSATTTSRSR